MTANTTCSYATLSVQSVEISAQNIADILQVQIGKLREAGQPISPRLPDKIAEHSTWQLSSSSEKNASGVSEDEPIDKHIQYIVDFLEEKREALNLLQAKCDLDIWCFVSFEKSHHGFGLSHDLIHRISQFRVNLILDIYGQECE